MRYLDMVQYLDVTIAQQQRDLDMQERALGYDPMPLSKLVLSPSLATDYKLPPFENAAIVTWLHLSYDQAANVTDVFLYHPSIIGGKQLVVRFQFTGAANPTKNWRMTVPAGAQIGFNTVSGNATYTFLSVGWSRSEETPDEYFRGTNVGRLN